jgi:hypothetical protein
MSGDRFARNGSPLAGRVVPHDWAAMDYTAKKACVLANGWAGSFYEAGVVLAQHAAAAVRGRKAKAARVAMAQARWED